MLLLLKPNYIGKAQGWTVVCAPAITGCEVPGSLKHVRTCAAHPKPVQVADQGILVGPAPAAQQAHRLGSLSTCCALLMRMPATRGGGGGAFSSHLDGVLRSVNTASANGNISRLPLAPLMDN